MVFLLMSIARHHAEWLSLVPVSGPFLSLPVLLEAFPYGLGTPTIPNMPGCCGRLTSSGTRTSTAGGPIRPLTGHGSSSF